jgi:hypothetical protein
VFAKIEEHIDDPGPHLARRFQGPGVVPLGPHLAPPPDGAVDGARTPHGESLDTADQPQPFVGLGDQVNVILLNREMNDAKIALGRCRQGPAHRAEGAFRSQ